MDSARILAIMQEVADEVIRPKFRALTAGEIEQKLPGDFVTVVDRAAELAIAERLSSLAPAALIVGEEETYYSAAKLDALSTAELAYTIDPIDGTRNFVQGSPDYAVMIAEVRSGETTRAWIWQPELSRAFTAELGAGCFLNDEPILSISRDRAPIGATSNEAYRYHDAGGTVAPVICSAWSAGFDYPNLITGKVDYLFYSHLMPWDHLPGGLMVTEAGGVTRTLAGVPYNAAVRGRRLIAAASPEIWELAAAGWPPAPTA